MIAGVKREFLCNNGTCEDIGNSHRCHCFDGYKGSYCNEEINECESAPCQNGATCQDLVGSYKCHCATGFQGQDCDLNIDDCTPNPCQNGATCHDLISNYSCSCPHGIYHVQLFFCLFYYVVRVLFLDECILN